MRSSLQLLFARHRGVYSHTGTFPCLSLLAAFEKQGSHPRCLRAGCTSSWGLEGEACVGFFPFSLSAGTLLPQISLWPPLPPALVPREPQAAGRAVLGRAVLSSGWDGVRRWQIPGAEQRPWNSCLTQSSLLSPGILHNSDKTSWGNTPFYELGFISSQSKQPWQGLKTLPVQR